MKPAALFPKMGDCLVTNGRKMSALWAMLQITSAPSVKPLKNSPEHFPLGEITSKLCFYSVCTFSSYYTKGSSYLHLRAPVPIKSRWNLQL